jgi:phospholipid/cholesterol/gamma-HCH transport system permease protein
MPQDEAHKKEGHLKIDPVPAGGITLRLSGVLSNATVPTLWPKAEEALTDAAPARLVVDASGVTYMDGAGMALLLRLQTRAEGAGAQVELRGLSQGYQRLLNRFSISDFRPESQLRGKCLSLPDQVGETTAHLWNDFRGHLVFLGEISESMVRALLHPRKVRWSDLSLAAERGGADALPIVALISWLVGLVLAFQSAMAMRPYGAEIYVANLVTVAMLRELGPLMTAIILAGRSGGAFAAEIGTMKVNDEVAALSTMGLNPVPFLAVPRVLGLVITIPFLTLFSDILGILGGATVFLSFEYPISTYFNQVRSAADLRHLLSGLVKSFAFGITLAGVGCMRGLQALRGPSAVGQSTTSAVVTSILLIVIIDAVLGTVFYFLDF